MRPTARTGLLMVLVLLSSAGAAATTITVGQRQPANVTINGTVHSLDLGFLGANYTTVTIDGDLRAVQMGETALTQGLAVSLRAINSTADTATYQVRPAPDRPIDYSIGPITFGKVSNGTHTMVRATAPVRYRNADGREFYTTYQNDPSRNVFDPEGNGSTTVSWQVTADAAATVPATITVDPEDLVQETNESNNRRTRQYVPSLAATWLGAIPLPDALAAGATETLSVRLGNSGPVAFNGTVTTMVRVGDRVGRRTVDITVPEGQEDRYSLPFSVPETDAERNATVTIVLRDSEGRQVATTSFRTRVDPGASAEVPVAMTDVGTVAVAPGRLRITASIVNRGTERFTGYLYAEPQTDSGRRMELGTVTVPAGDRQRARFTVPAAGLFHGTGPAPERSLLAVVLTGSRTPYRNASVDQERLRVEIEPRRSAWNIRIGGDELTASVTDGRLVVTGSIAAHPTAQVSTTTGRNSTGQRRITITVDGPDGTHTAVSKFWDINTSVPVEANTSVMVRVERDLSSDSPTVQGRRIVLIRAGSIEQIIDPMERTDGDRPTGPDTNTSSPAIDGPPVEAMSRAELEAAVLRLRQRVEELRRRLAAADTGGAGRRVPTARQGSGSEVMHAGGGRPADRGIIDRLVGLVTGGSGPAGPSRARGVEPETGNVRQGTRVRTANTTPPRRGQRINTTPPRSKPGPSERTVENMSREQLEQEVRRLRREVHRLRARLVEATDGKERPSSQPRSGERGMMDQQVQKEAQTRRGPGQGRQEQGGIIAALLSLF